MKIIYQIQAFAGIVINHRQYVQTAALSEYTFAAFARLIPS